LFRPDAAETFSVNIRNYFLQSTFYGGTSIHKMLGFKNLSPIRLRCRIRDFAPPAKNCYLSLRYFMNIIWL